ncbi:MAG TPA: hypothetical protein VFZ91_00170 [Allosphingosinicella sp.]
MTQVAEPTLGWEHLVTPGHVRAARIRRVQPMLIATAIVLMLFGWLLIGIFQPGRVANDRSKILASEVERRQRVALETFSGLAKPRIGMSQVAALPAASSLADRQARILAELNRSDSVPADLGLKDVAPPTFWRVPWKAGELYTTARGNVRLVGGLVNAGSADAPLPGRWLAAFRDAGDGWQAVTIEGPDFVQLPDTPSVAIETIPVTLDPLLATKD